MKCFIWSKNLDFIGFVETFLGSKVGYENISDTNSFDNIEDEFTDYPGLDDVIITHQGVAPLPSCNNIIKLEITDDGGVKDYYPLEKFIQEHL